MRYAFRLVLALGVACLVATASPRTVQSTHLKIIVGVTDDTAKWMVRQDGIVGVHRDLRLMVVRVTIPWRPGQVKPTKLQQVYLHRIARMTQLNDRIVLAVYNTAELAPTTRTTRNEYCAFVQGAVKRVPPSTTSRSGTRRTLRRTGPHATAQPPTPSCWPAATTCCTAVGSRST